MQKRASGSGSKVFWHMSGGQWVSGCVGVCVRRMSERLFRGQATCLRAQNHSCWLSTTICLVVCHSDIYMNSMSASRDHQLQGYPQPQPFQCYFPTLSYRLSIKYEIVRNRLLCIVNLGNNDMELLSRFIAHLDNWAKYYWYTNHAGSTDIELASILWLELSVEMRRFDSEEARLDDKNNIW